MMKTIAFAALAAAAALPAVAQPAFTGPTPAEQVGMFIGATSANGSATIVEDRTGVHPDGFTGQPLVNHTSAAHPPADHHRWRRDRAAD